MASCKREQNSLLVVYLEGAGAEISVLFLGKKCLALDAA
jgi:hypothetical protein